MVLSNHALLSVAVPVLLLQAKLEEKERKHFLKTKGISFEGAHISGSSSSSFKRTQHTLFAGHHDSTAMASI
jgi:hypothetical protein